MAYKRLKSELVFAAVYRSIRVIRGALEVLLDKSIHNNTSVKELVG